MRPVRAEYGHIIFILGLMGGILGQIICQKVKIIVKIKWEGISNKIKNRPFLKNSGAKCEK